MSTNPRFQVGDIVEYDGLKHNYVRAPRGPFMIKDPPSCLTGTVYYHYDGWYYPEQCLKLVKAVSPVDVDIGELL